MKPRKRKLRPAQLAAILDRFDRAYITDGSGKAQDDLVALIAHARATVPVYVPPPSGFKRRWS